MASPSRGPHLQPDLPAETYSYTSLVNTPAHIRILDLLPASSPAHPLHGNLYSEQLLPQTVTPYEAISYAWGGHDKPCELVLNGKVLPIGKNLDAALRVFRLKDTSRRIWADAVCIDQSSDIERTQQVAIMTTIYKNASATLAWLGDDHDRHGSKALAALTWIHTSYDQLKYMSPGEGPLHIYCQHHQALSLPATHAHLQHFCFNRYFERRWVVQEIAVSKHVTFWCGTSHVTLTALKNMMSSLLAQSFFAIETYTISADQLMELLSAPGYLSSKRGGILVAMEKFYQWKCQDPRDRIAAMQWTMDASRLHNFTIDYSQSVNDNYHRFAFMINLSTSYEIMSLLASASKRQYPESSSDQSLPSWVPDWRTTPRLFEIKQSGEYEPHVEITVYWLSSLEAAGIWAKRDPSTSDVLVLEHEGAERLSFRVRSDDAAAFRIAESDIVLRSYFPGHNGEVSNILLKKVPGSFDRWRIAGCFKTTAHDRGVTVSEGQPSRVKFVIE